MKERISFCLATAFCIGTIPGAPGTYASLATALAFYQIYRIEYRMVPALHLSAICLITFAGIFASMRVSRRLNDEDPKSVVIDEVAGQLTALLFVPVNFWNLGAAFVLFRIFDIWKPYPIRKLESLRNGVGIMADDLVAGAYASAVLQLANRFLHTI